MGYDVVGPKKSSLLKEAIDDARAVRATALANAKTALNETFADYNLENIISELENSEYSRTRSKAKKIRKIDVGNLTPKEAETLMKKANDVRKTVESFSPEELRRMTFEEWQKRVTGKLSYDVSTDTFSSKKYDAFNSEFDNKVIIKSGSVSFPSAVPLPTQSVKPVVKEERTFEMVGAKKVYKGG